MAHKAIQVTKTNKDQLTNRFQHEGTGVDMAIGYFLVAQFGDDGDYEMLSPAVFNQNYTRGETLRNGFFEAVRKDIPNG